MSTRALCNRLFLRFEAFKPLYWEDAFCKGKIFSQNFLSFFENY